SEGTDKNLWLDETLAKEIVESIPLRRTTTAAEVAESIAFLADEAKAGYITGACLPVDGGHWLTGTNMGFLEAIARASAGKTLYVPPRCPGGTGAGKPAAVVISLCFFLFVKFTG
ncbi:MAG TPA: SDR family oxidoreductase, partial [Thermoanaerobaculia bacterium]|nr:SDR family oxidoreductase [Thermoanaerobaculia bacterium]